MKTINKKLGSLLHQRRKEKRLTLKQLAKVADASVSYIGRIERGERSPTAFVLVKLAEPLGFGRLELLTISGLLPKDQIDDRILQFKKKITMVVLDNTISLMREIDSL